MKRILFLIASACWFVFALGFAAIFVQGLTDSPHPALFRFIFGSGDILMDLIHEIGFSIGAILCLAISAGLWAHAMVRDREKKEPDDNA